MVHFNVGYFSTLTKKCPRICETISLTLEWINGLCYKIWILRIHLGSNVAIYFAPEKIVNVCIMIDFTNLLLKTANESINFCQNIFWVLIITLDNDCTSWEKYYLVWCKILFHFKKLLSVLSFTNLTSATYLMYFFAEVHTFLNGKPLIILSSHSKNTKKSECT